MNLIPSSRVSNTTTSPMNERMLSCWRLSDTTITWITSESEDYELSDTAMETSGEIPLSSKVSVALKSVSGRKTISVSRVASH